VSEPCPPLPGDLSRRYTPVRVLGRGGMGVVVLANDAVLKREVALKLIADHAVESEARARFLREVRTMAQLTHPGIVRLFDGGHSGEALYLAMEVLDGEPLAEVIGRGWAPAQTVAFLRALLDALAYVHERGILHRDLKPGNVMVVQGSPRILDFGLARTIEATALTAADAVVGTPRYLAPEVITGTPHSVRSDLFAVGMIGVEMLIGGPALPLATDPESLREMMVQMASGGYIGRVGGLLAPYGELGRVLLGALAADPARRPAAATELAEALGRAPAPAAPVARARAAHPGEPTERLPGRARRVPSRPTAVPVGSAGAAPAARRGLALAGAGACGRAALFAALAPRRGGPPSPDERSTASPIASAVMDLPALDRRLAQARGREGRGPLVEALLAAAAAGGPDRFRVSERAEGAVLDHWDDLLDELRPWWGREAKRESDWRKAQEVRRLGRIPRDWRDAYRRERERDDDPELRAMRARIETLEPAAIALLRALAVLELSHAAELALGRDALLVFECAALHLPGDLPRFDLALRKAGQGGQGGPALALLQARLHDLRGEHASRARALRRLARELLADPGPARELRSLRALRASELAYVATLLCDNEKQLITSAQSAPPEPGEPSPDDLIARLTEVPAEVAGDKRVVRALELLARCQVQRRSKKAEETGEFNRLIGR
jgi:hypothetical protein